MFTVWTIGELLVEIMRTERDQPLNRTGLFAGPYPSGAPAIFIDAMGKWGANAGIISAVGADAFGDNCLDRLIADGVDVTGVERLADLTTAMAFVNYKGDGSRDFLFHVGQSALSHMRFPDDWEQRCQSIDLLHITGSSLLMQPIVQLICLQTMIMVHRCGGKISFDPNIRPELISNEVEVKQKFAQILQKTDFLFPSSSELTWMTDAATDIEAAKLLVDGGITAIVLKDGKRGASLIAKELQLSSAAFPVDEVDPTGAGDVFCAGFMFGQMQGWPYERSLNFANAAGALAVTALGPMEGIVPLREVQHFMNTHGRS